MTDQTARIESVGADEEPPAGYERRFDQGVLGWGLFGACVLYAAWHLWVLNVAPLETLTFRIAHIAGALAIGFAIAMPFAGRPEALLPTAPRWLGLAAGLAAIAVLAWPASAVAVAWHGFLTAGVQQPDASVFAEFGRPLAAGTALAIVSGWLFPGRHDRPTAADWALILASLTVAGFLLFSLDNLSLRLRAGTAFADPQNGWAAAVGVALILELTRRVAGMALVVIAAVFVVYSFVGPWLPGFLQHSGYDAKRFFTYVYTDNGILGPTTAVSSTYISSR
jgi:TRAP-type uncharacterized transport system, fused permease components